MSERSASNQDTYPFIDPRSLDTLLQLGLSDNGKVLDIYYDELVAGSASQLWLPSQTPFEEDDSIIRPRGYIPPVPEVVEPRVNELVQAKEGLAAFLALTMTVVNKWGEPDAAVISPERMRDGLDTVERARWLVYKVCGNNPNSVYRNSDGSLAMLPYLGYQGEKKYTEGVVPGIREKAKFLHFGTNPNINDPTLAGSVRVYLNPRVESTPSAVAAISSDFYDHMGYIPDGKFVEDVTALTFEDRRDRAIFWANSTEELSTILAATRQVSAQHPEYFEGRKSLPLGTPVVISGVELPTARLGQEPPTLPSGGIVESFNGSRLRLVNFALSKAFSNGASGNHMLDSQRLEAALKEVASEEGISIEDVNFNADQDMSVIHNAVLAAA